MHSTNRSILAASLLLVVAPSCGTSVQAEFGASTATGAGGHTTGSSGTSGNGAGGGSTSCVPGALIDCYSGPPGTQNVGVCHGGAKKCDAGGTSFGPCQWEVTPTPENCATPADENCDGKTPPCSGKALWSEAFGPSGNQYGFGVAVDGAGNLIVLGGFDATITLGATTLTTVGQDDAFVAKLDPKGNVIWAKGFGSPGKDYASTVAVDAAGRIFISGSFDGDIDFGDGNFVKNKGQSDAFLIALDANGALVWKKTFADSGIDIGYGVATDAAGNVYTTGMFNGTVDFGTGPLKASAADIYVAAFDNGGKSLWARSFGAAYDDAGYRIGVDPKGDIVVVGGFHGPVDFGTGTLQTAGYYDGFVAAFSPGGNTLWAKAIKGSAKMGSYAVTLGLTFNAAGGPVIAGYFWEQVDFGGGTLVSAGGSDAFVASYDASGKHLFSKRFGSSYVYPQQPTYVTDVAYGVALDGSGELVVGGAYIDTIDFGGGPLTKAAYGGAFLAKLDAAGKVVFSKGLANDVSYTQIGALAIAPPSDVVVTGSFSGTVDLGTGPLTSPTPQDADLFVARLAP